MDKKLKIDYDFLKTCDNSSIREFEEHVNNQMRKEEKAREEARIARKLKKKKAASERREREK